jgi:hypothetical protein
VYVVPHPFIACLIRVSSVSSTSNREHSNQWDPSSTSLKSCDDRSTSRVPTPDPGRRKGNYCPYSVGPRVYPTSILDPPDVPSGPQANRLIPHSRFPPITRCPIGLPRRLLYIGTITALRTSMSLRIPLSHIFNCSPRPVRFEGKELSVVDPPVCHYYREPEGIIDLEGMSPLSTPSARLAHLSQPTSCTGSRLSMQPIWRVRDKPSAAERSRASFWIYVNPASYDTRS